MKNAEPRSRNSAYVNRALFPIPYSLFIIFLPKICTFQKNVVPLHPQYFIY